MLIDYECKQQSKHTKLKIGWGVVIVVALAAVIVLCCTGHDRVASEVVGRLSFK